MISAMWYVVSSPTKSRSVKGPIGCPAPSCIPLSMSSTDATPASSARIASSMYGTRRRLTTNPDVSFARQLGLVAGGDCAYDLNQLHQRNWIEEMKTEHAVGASTRGSHLGDSETGCV